MSRPSLEVADIFRGHGPAWRRANAGHVSLGQLKVMSAIENCRTAALGGHVARCEECTHSQISYNSCRNRHCPKCQTNARDKWLAARNTELLPVPYVESEDVTNAVVWLGSSKARHVTGVTLPIDAGHIGLESLLILAPEALRLKLEIVIHFLVGPEAGFSDAEEARIRAAGFEGVTLGPRVMRTETAALAALAAIHGRWGDF